MTLITPLMFPKNVRASEVRSVESGCLTRTVLDWMYLTNGYMWFHMGTGVHSAFEHNMREGLSASHDARAIMVDVAMEYVWDKVTEDQELGIETIFANHTPDMDAVESAVEQCVSNWCRDVHPASDQRPFWLDGEVWPPEIEKKAELPGFATDIDAVFPDDDGFVVVDWKSGDRPKADPIQLRIYAWALRQLGYGPCREAAFYHAKPGEWQFVEVPDTEGEDAYIEHLVQATALIKGDEALALTPRKGWYCERLCPHATNETCPAFGGDLTELQDVYRMGTWTDSKVQRD